MLIPKTFYFVRHGQTDKNLQGVFQGSSNVPLNQTGIAQAQQARDRLKNEPFAAIVCSPLKRARTTADIINEKHKLPIAEDYDLREAEFGPYENLPYEPWLMEYLAGDDSNCPDDIEPLHEFRARTKAAINRALEASNEPVLIVAHGGVYLSVNDALAPDQKRPLHNCASILHEPDNGNWQVREI